MHGVDKREEILEERQCTDLICCVVFAIFLAGMVVIFGIALNDGNPKRLYHGFNYAGKLCGVDESVSGRPLLFWPKNEYSITDGKTPICVDRCPNADDVAAQKTVRYPKRTTVDVESETDENTVVSETTIQYVDSPVYETVKYMHAYCMPTAAEKGASSIIENSQSNSFWEQTKRGMASLADAWPVLLVGAFLALGLAFVFLFMMQCCAHLIIWVAVIIVCCLFLGLGTYLTYTGFTTHTNFLLERFGDDAAIWSQVIGIIMIIVGIVIAVSACFGNSLAIAAGVIEAACECLFDMPKLLLTPLINFVGQGLVYSLGLIGLMWLLSCGSITSKAVSAMGIGINGGDALELHGIHRSFEADQHLQAMICLWIFGVLWVAEFFIALGQFVVSFAVVLWYFTLPDGDGDRDVDCPLGIGYKVALVYHTGTLAMGSFLIAVCRFVKYTLEFLKRQAQRSGANNAILNTVITICQCLVQCCECCLRCINNNAYVECAINSTGFCRSARKAFARLLVGGPSVIILNMFTKVFSILGVLCVSLLVTWLGHISITNISYFSDSSSDWYVNSPVLVSLVMFIIAASVGVLVMTLFDQASDAILYCFLVEKEDGGNYMTVYAPQTLKDVIQDVDGDRGDIQEKFVY